MVFYIDNNKKCYDHQNRNILIISEGPCDIEDWSNDCWKFIHLNLYFTIVWPQTFKRWSTFSFKNGFIPIKKKRFVFHPSKISSMSLQSFPSQTNALNQTCHSLLWACVLRITPLATSGDSVSRKGRRITRRTFFPLSRMVMKTTAPWLSPNLNTFCHNWKPLPFLQIHGVAFPNCGWTLCQHCLL